MNNALGNMKVLISILIIALGTFLTSVNIYGSYMNIRPAVFFDDELRFSNDSPLAFDQALKQIIKNTDETNLQYS